MHIVKSVRGKRTLFFAGYKHGNKRKPRFTPKQEDAMYLDLVDARLVRDNLTDSQTKATIGKAPAEPRMAMVNSIVDEDGELRSPEKWTLDDLHAVLTS